MTDPDRVHPSYKALWRGVLAEVAHWPEARIAEFCAHYEKYEAAYGPYSMLYHRIASDYVAPFLIPDSLRDRLRSSGRARHVLELETRIMQEIERATATKELQNTDWHALKARIATILAEHSEQIASFDGIEERWKHMQKMADRFGREDD